MRLIIRIAGVIAFSGTVYLFGIYSAQKDLWPASRMRTVATSWLAQGSVRTDEFGRLLRYPGKTETPCPSPDENTAVLLVFGQSNAANSQGQRHQGVNNQVINFSQGRCYLAQSPLLGADGRSGESWTLLANKLVASGLYRTVILIPAAVGNTSVSRWVPGADLGQMLVGLIRQAKQQYRVTAILWHQGSNDVALRTPEETYKSKLKSVIRMIRSEGVMAPFYVSRSSLVLGGNWSSDNPVARAQAALVDDKTIFAGPNTDRDVSALDRYDGLHFGASGQEKFADAWLRLLSAQKAAEQ